MNNPPHKFKKLYLWSGLIILLGIILTPLMFNNAKQLSTAMLTKTYQKTTPMPLYYYLYANQKDHRDQRIIVATDFAGVYLTARDFNKGNVYNGKFDSLGHPHVYPPFVYWLYNHTFCHFDLSKAVLLHLLFQIILLLVSTYYILQYYNLKLLFIPFFMIYSILLFLTPVGLSELERGQFDIYQATSFLWFLFALNEKKGYAFVLSAIFASLKWTTAPFFAQAFLIYLLLEKDPLRFKFFALFIGTIFLTLIAFPEHSIKYLTTLFNLQSSYVEGDITLVGKAPIWLLFLIPILSIALYLISILIIKDRKVFSLTSLPFLAGLAVLDLMLFSVSYQYRAIYLLGFLPISLIWFWQDTNHKLYKILFLLIFIPFLIFIYHGFWFIHALPIKGDWCPAYYLSFFFIVTILSILKNVRTALSSHSI